MSRDSGCLPLRNVTFLQILFSLAVLLAMAACGRSGQKQPQGTTLLHWAAEKGDTEIVMILIQRGVQIDRTDGMGRTPLEVAVEHDQPEVVLQLIDAGAEYGIPVPGGGTLLHWAAERGYIEVMKRLLAAESAAKQQEQVGSELPLVEQLDDEGYTAIERAAQNNERDAVLFLLKRGAPPDRVWERPSRLKNLLF